PDLGDGQQRDRKRGREVGPEDAGNRRPQLAVHARRRAAGRSPHPPSFEPQHYLDPSLRPLMNRIRVAESSEFTRHFPQELQSRIDVVTRSGQRFTEQATYPKGHARNPMTDADVETKFRDLSVDVLGDARVNAAVHALWHLDE